MKGTRGQWLVVLVLVAVATWYASRAQGLTSSNDGSHVALGRALVLRQSPVIGEEVGLTLWTDWSRRGGRDYSDRPPGTAITALPALAIGAALDPRWRDRSIARIREGVDPRNIDDVVVVRPASNRYLQTYGIRRQQHQGPSVNLLALQGTALLVGLHAALVGVLGLFGLCTLCRRRSLRPSGQIAVALAIGLGTLWAPYSSVLFSHVTTGAWLVWCLVALEQARDQPQRRRFTLAAGLCGSAAVGCDYTVVIIVVPWMLLHAPPKRWPQLVVGATPFALATAAYHYAAFGSVFAIGYDHHVTFEFARSRSRTFGGSPLDGLWTLWGAGQSAGVLLRAPIALVAVAGLACERRIVAGLAPWFVLLCFHQTPTGGASADHRYLVPSMAVIGVGLVHAWSFPHGTKVVRVTLAVLASVGFVSSW